MKTLVSMFLAIAAVFCAPQANAQLPPDLLGNNGSGVTDKFYSEPFYKSMDGMWVLMREHENAGLKCSVNFISTGQSMAIHGPWDAAMRKKGVGMVWFDGKQIPKAGAKPERVRLDLGSLDGPQKGVPAMHLNMGEDNGMMILYIDIRKTLKEKRDSDRITLSMDGVQIFDLPVTQLQKAYGRLGKCMEAGKR